MALVFRPASSIRQSLWRPALDAALAALRPVCSAVRYATSHPAGARAKNLHEELSADYTDMIYAKDATKVQSKRKAFLREWKLKCRAVADSLEEARDHLFTFLRYPESQWRSIRTTNAFERRHE